MNAPTRPPGRRSAPASSSTAAPVSEAELAELDELLMGISPPLQALDLSALDGFLVGILLQPRRPEPRQWLPLVSDEAGRPIPAGMINEARLQALVLKRLRQLDAAIQGRQWFDPWILDEGEEASPHESVQPWVLGFATACAHFPELTDREDPEFNEALAGLYQHLDAADLEDADALLEEIETLEPPATLEEAVESLVRSSLLLADISRPLARGGRTGQTSRGGRASPTGPRRPRPATKG